MNLPYQAASIDRENSTAQALGGNVDPALFGLSWSDVANGLGSAVKTVAPYALQAAKALL